MSSERIFGAVVTLGALAYLAGATQIQTGFMADPVGPRTFPMLIGAVGALCGIVVLIRPDSDPEWPGLAALGALLVAVMVLVGYAYALKPLGFLLPTVVAAAILSWQIEPRPGPSAIVGVGLSIGLFLIFKWVLGLGLMAFPKILTG